jgi:hypothetical protein
MKAARHVLLAMAALGFAGCAALNRGSLATKPRPVGERTLDVDAFVREHNRNADLVQSLQAKPTIAVKGKLMHAQADGRLGMVRPGNFKLEVSGPTGQTQANIGSNDEEFWFWVQSNDDRSIYWCKYDDLESSALAVTYQPDWIIGALGLKPITPEEAAAIRVEKTDDPNCSAVIFPPARSQGESYLRMMIVSNYTRRIKEHRLCAPDRGRTILAQAFIAGYKEYELEKSESGAFRSCYLPENLRLEWKKDQLTLDVALKDVSVNQFDESRAAAIFVEPVIPGYERVNLADMARSPTRDNRTTVRRTRPIPGPRNSVKLGRPTPVIDEPDKAPQARASGPGRSAGGISSPLEDLVGAPVPAAPESESSRQATWAAADNSPLGR